jgi:hypothetical protein
MKAALRLCVPASEIYRLEISIYAGKTAQAGREQSMGQLDMTQMDHDTIMILTCSPIHYQS